MLGSRTMELGSKPVAWTSQKKVPELNLDGTLHQKTDWVEDEDIGVAKDKPEVDVEDAVGVPKDKLGFEVAGLLK